jgi:hypothetical protein
VNYCRPLHARTAIDFCFPVGTDLKDCFPRILRTGQPFLMFMPEPRKLGTWCIQTQPSLSEWFHIDFPTPVALSIGRVKWCYPKQTRIHQYLRVTTHPESDQVYCDYGQCRWVIIRLHKTIHGNLLETRVDAVLEWFEDEVALP